MFVTCRLSCSCNSPLNIQLLDAKDSLSTLMPILGLDTSLALVSFSGYTFFLSFTCIEKVNNDAGKEKKDKYNKRVLLSFQCRSSWLKDNHETAKFCIMW